MEYSSMYYIQNYKKSIDNDNKGIDRIISGDYMGSAEFEFGSVQNSWKLLRENELVLQSHEIQSKGGKKAKVVLWIVTTKEGHDRFIDRIPNHLDGTVSGRKTKEQTNIWEKFNSERTDYTNYPDAWLDVTDCAGAAYSPETSIPVFFTDDERLAKQIYLELQHPTIEDIPSDLHIGDMVKCYLDDDEYKVVGLNEDDSISIKKKYGKAYKMHPRDLWKV